MSLKLGITLLCLLAEIALGIYTYMHFENLLTRFLFFAFTAALVAMLVIKLANPEPTKDKDDNFSPSPKVNKAKQDIEKALDPSPDMDFSRQ